MVTVLPVPCDLLKDAAQAQVVAWDERFHVAAEVDAVVNAKAQSSAFGHRDATGVEAVKDVMPTERSTFQRLVREAPSDRAVEVLDFGCGDGRYLRQFLRSAEALAESGRALRIVAYEVSAEALRSFHIQAQREGLAVVESRSQDSDAHLPSLEGRNLQLEFVLGSCSMTALQVGELLQRWGPRFDVTVIGWGTISSIPRLPGLSAEELLHELSKVSRFVMNVVSSTNNHVKFQRRYQAMRRAWSETVERPMVRAWLEQKIGLATFDRSYYYTVDTKQKMFYSAISADLEAARLKEAGYDSVRVQICNIINFFDIQTKPRAARINAAVIRLLERRDVWGAQLLLSRGVAKAFKKPLSSLQTGSCIFDNSSEHALYGQVARYFISTGESQAQRGAK